MVTILTQASSTKLPRQRGAIENHHQSILKREKALKSFAASGDTGIFIISFKNDFLEINPSCSTPDNVI